jgi:LAS superfamily LD-carboxypeptidase LdcB
VSGASSCILGTQNGCSGQVARGLTNQIAAKLGQMGYSFKTLDANRIHCSGGCVNMLQASAADSLAQAAASANDYITLNSAWRSSAEQYMLYRWYQKGMCGITLAAKPGQSNHEGGRAVDTSYYNHWLNTLANHGWEHTYPSSDPVHFDYNGAANIAKQNLMAFQTLWNEHNSNKLTVDGIYGPSTENALYNAPCGGW